MKVLNSLFGAAVLAAAFAAPAAAEFVRLGTVDVGFRNDVDTAYSQFDGRLESLRFTATRSDIFCRRIVVTYDNGERQNVFSGRLDERNPVSVDLRGRARRIDNIRFVCRSDEFRGGKIHIMGEAGRWRGEWGGRFGGPGPHGGHGPHDGRGPHDGYGPHGGHGPHDGRGGDWVTLGVQSFEGRNDRESNFTGFAGRHVDRLAFRPIETDARCMSIVATFASGRKVKLADGRVLERGRLNVYDLPGRDHDITKVYMRCRALGGHRVRIEVLGRR